MHRKAILATALLLSLLLAVPAIGIPVAAAGAGPALMISYPTDGVLTKATTITVNGTTNGTSVTVNGQPAALGSGTYTTQVQLAEGANTILVEARDSGGNATSKAVTVVRDTTVPVLVITSPIGPYETNNRTLHVDGTVEPGCSVTVNGTAATVTSDRFSATITIDNKTQTVTARATDKAGNVGTSSVQIIYDVMVNLSIRTDFDGIILNETDSKDDIEAPFASFTILGKTDPGASAAVNGEQVAIHPNGTFAQTVKLKKGKNNITVTVTDKAGNSKTQYVNVKRLDWTWEPYVVPMELAVGFLILGLIIGSIGGHFHGRKKERDVQAKKRNAEARARPRVVQPAAPPKPAPPKPAPPKARTKQVVDPEEDDTGE